MHLVTHARGHHLVKAHQLPEKPFLKKLEEEINIRLKSKGRNIFVILKKIILVFPEKSFFLNSSVAKLRFYICNVMS